MKEWIEEHPYLTGGGVLALIVLFFVLRGSGGGSSASQSSGASAGGGLSSSDYAGLQAAQLASQTSLAQTNIAATAHQNDTDAALAATQIKANADVTQAQLAQQVALQNIISSGQIQMYTDDATLKGIYAQTGAQVSLADIGAGRDVKLAGIQGDVQKTQFEDALRSQQIISDAQTQQSQINSDTQLGIAGYARDTQLGIANYAAQVQLAGIQGDTTKSLAITAADVTKTQFNDDAQKFIYDRYFTTQKEQFNIDSDNKYGFLNNVVNRTGYQVNKEQQTVLQALFGIVPAPVQNNPTSFGLSTPYGGFSFSH